MPEQQSAVLDSHIFLKKRSGEIKGRQFAGGSKQWSFISKEDVSLPTVSMESMLLSLMADAAEGIDAAIIYIPNAFIQMVLDGKKDKVVICSRGMLVDILIKVAPDIYWPFVSEDKNDRKQILIKYLNAMYGTLVASLLYYKQFSKSLKSKDIDDCKILHTSSEVVDNFIEWLCND